jgi:hypothetical protein
LGHKFAARIATIKCKYLLAHLRYLVPVDIQSSFIYTHLGAEHELIAVAVAVSKTILLSHLLVPEMTEGNGE